MLGHKTSLRKFKIEIIPGIFTKNKSENKNQLQQENWKKYNHLETKHMLFKNQWVNEEIKEEIKKYFEMNETRNIILQI